MPDLRNTHYHHTKQNSFNRQNWEGFGADFSRAEWWKSLHVGGEAAAQIASCRGELSMEVSYGMREPPQSRASFCTGSGPVNVVWDSSEQGR